MSKNTSLLDIPWDDVIFCCIFPNLTLRDIFNVRLTSVNYRKLANSYISKMKSIDFQIELNCNEMMFLAENTRCLLKMGSPEGKASNQFVECIIKNNKSLTHVDLSNTCLSDRSLLGLIYCKNLRQLQFRNCSWLTNESLSVLFHHLQYIEYLNATVCIRLDPYDVCNMLNGLPWFKYATISNGSICLICSPAKHFTWSIGGWLNFT